MSGSNFYKNITSQENSQDEWTLRGLLGAVRDQGEWAGGDKRNQDLETGPHR